MNDITTWTPEQVDTALAAAHADAAKAGADAERALIAMHYAAGDRRDYVRRGRRTVQVWRMTDEAVLAFDITTLPAWDARNYTQAAERRDAAHAARTAARVTIDAYDAEFTRRGGWSRFFLVDGGHIHSSMNCSTCNNGATMTSFGWLPALSGLTEAEAVAAHGAILCTVCFPSAPVEWTNGHELEAAAKAAAQCAGGGTYYGNHEHKGRTGGWAPRYVRCANCGQSVSVTSTGKLRAHKPAAK